MGPRQKSGKFLLGLGQVPGRSGVVLVLIPGGIPVRSKSSPKHVSIRPWVSPGQVLSRSDPIPVKSQESTMVKKPIYYIKVNYVFDT